MANHYISNRAIDLGQIAYGECLEIQLKLVSLRKAGSIGDTILFLEHNPPVYTIGRKSDPKNWPGIDPIRTERGGDVTYHSPGQLVIYPILDLMKNGRVDVRSHVRNIENIVIDALKENGAEAYIGEEEPGIWTFEGNRKVASVGMAIDGHVSYHGIAINYTGEPLAGFNRISPCGLDPSVMGYVDISRNVLVGSLMRQFSRCYSEFALSPAGAFLMEIDGLAYETGSRP